MSLSCAEEKRLKTALRHQLFTQCVYSRQMKWKLMSTLDVT